MAKLSIAASLKTQMLEQKADIAWAGDPDLLLSAYYKTNGKVVHPLDCIQAVLAAARKSKLFLIRY